MRALLISFLLSFLSACTGQVHYHTGLDGVHPALNSTNSYFEKHSGRFYVTKSVHFVNSANVDSELDDFYWLIPKEVNTLIINADVTIYGHLRMQHGQTIKGENRASSRIYGTMTKAWARGEDKIENNGTSCARNGKPAAVVGDDRVHDCEKWLYGGISVIPSADTNKVYTVQNLTVENPRTYAITAIKHTMHISQVDIINSRPVPDFQSNSDGLGFGPNSVVDDVYIDTWDDSIKLYRDNLQISNVTIVHNQNGAPFQLGWGNKKPIQVNMYNIKVIEGERYKGNRFNQALFSNARGRVNASINVDKFSAKYSENALLTKCDGLSPLPAVFLAGEGSVLKVLSDNEKDFLVEAPTAYCGAGNAWLNGRKM